jgi:hypothetical protein
MQAQLRQLHFKTHKFGQTLVSFYGFKYLWQSKQQQHTNELFFFEF